MSHLVRICRAIALGALVPVSLACSHGSQSSQAPAPARADSSSVAIGQGKSMENLFVGRFPGVAVSRTDNGGLQIRVRGGGGTFYGGEEPLYVIDDTPLPPGSGGVVFLNPNDIEKIEVLKNPADIGIYGMRGANGVVKITTKKTK